jgi:6-phosphogluconolactonase (cycloisomerase 2 family)
VGTCPSAGPNTLGATVSPNGRFFYQVNGSSNTVSPFAIGTDGTLTPIACSGSNCHTGVFPVGAAMSTDGRFLYVTNQSAGTVSEFSVGVGGSLSPLCTTTCPTTGTNPIGIAVAPNGKSLYVGNRGAGTISPFSINTDGTLSPIACTGSNCTTTSTNLNDIAVSPNGRFLYGAGEDTNSIFAFAIGADGSITPITCSGCSDAGGPANLAITPDSRFLYAADNTTNTVSPFSINADGTLSPVACPGSNCNVGGGEDVFQIVASPDQAPVAAFTVSAGPPGSATSFNGATSTASPGQKVARYDWTFGDGASASNGGPTPSHVYAKPGTYTVTLTVTDDAGCSTQLIYTGQTMSCNGGSPATTTRLVTITPAAAHAPTAFTGPASNVTQATATLTGTVNPNGSATTFYFQYGTSTAYGSTTTTQSAGSDTSNHSESASVSGLLPGTTYHFRIVAKNAGGTSDGGDMTFTTPKRPLKLSVSPTRAEAGARVCLAFKASSNGHPVAGATVRLGNHTARTSHAGKATICLTLQHGTYHPSATKTGYRSARATVIANAALKPPPTFTA